MIAAAATAGPSAYWYLTRGTGAVAMLLLTVSVALGVANVRRARTEYVPRFVFDAVHRMVSLVAVAFVFVHVVTSLLDSFAPIRVVDAVVPFVSGYRPLWLGLGAVAFDLLLAVALTSVLRRRFGHRAWRTTHWLAYASWPVALVHGLGTGTDAKTTWMLFLTGACVIVVIVAVVARATAGWPEHVGARASAIVASVMVPVGLLVWLPSGPLAAGWAKRAGTPASLLAASSGSASQPTSTSAGAAASAPNSSSFSAQASGTVSQGQGDGGLQLVDISLNVGGQRLNALRIRIAGQPLGGGGVQMTSSRVTLGPASSPDQYRGKVTALRGSDVQAVVSDGSGSTLTLVAQIQIDPGTGNVMGTLSASPGATR